jgi:hypothetical protein
VDLYRIGGVTSRAQLMPRHAGERPTFSVTTIWCSHPV